MCQTYQLKVLMGIQAGSGVPGDGGASAAAGRASGARRLGYGVDERTAMQKFDSEVDHG